MSSFSTNVGEKFASNVITKFFETAVAPMITNDNYEGEIKGGGADRLNILSVAEDQGLQTYTGADLTLGNATESEGVLTVSQKKAYYFGIKSWDKFKSYAEDVDSDLIKQKAGELQEAVDAYVLGLYGDVGAGNRVGTDYTTGTVTVDVTTGAVTGSGTTFASGMVGKGFKALGHTAWYRVKTYSSTTAIVIEDDSDDDTSAYTGGAIAGGATYVIEANTAVQVTASTVYTKIVALRTKLNKTKTPKADRWLVIPADIAGVVDTCTELVHATQKGDDVVANGFMGRLAGFNVYENEEVSGDGTNGYHCMAGHKSAICFAMAFVETGVEDLQGNFGKAYKGLNCYGAKVIDRRRKALAEGFFKL
ncbi:MAG: hypothetical protein UR99_C0017G0028 [Candidatus Moranbacteria bacterium GW2011_GWD2_36_12]|nr:MAG: hypothetical protein UR99_C0017G0028 [Candidatus Moranbacteria bacterium GW2011_GWD2_36_12]